MSKWIWKPKVKRESEHVRLRPVSVTLEEDDEGPVTIYTVTLDNGDGEWSESVGTEHEASMFLKGVRAGVVMSAQNFQDFPVGLHEIKFYGERVPDPLEQAAGENRQEF